MPSGGKPAATRAGPKRRPPGLCARTDGSQLRASQGRRKFLGMAPPRWSRCPRSNHQIHSGEGRRRRMIPCSAFFPCKRISAGPPVKGRVFLPQAAPAYPGDAPGVPRGGCRNGRRKKGGKPRFARAAVLGRRRRRGGVGARMLAGQPSAGGGGGLAQTRRPGPVLGGRRDNSMVQKNPGGPGPDRPCPTLTPRKMLCAPFALKAAADHESGRAIFPD